MGIKILHTGDWHLGQKFYDYDRTSEHRAFLDWLINYIKVENVDALLIAGDIFDVANPSSLAQRLFYNFLYEVTQCVKGLQIILIAGNHDSAARLEAPSVLMEVFNITIVGNVKRKPDDNSIDWSSLIIPLKDKSTQNTIAYCLAVPFLRNGDFDITIEQDHSYTDDVRNFYQNLYEEVAQINQDNLPIIAMGHLHTSNAMLSDSERGIRGGLEVVDINSFHPNIAYVALGHIHKAQKVGGFSHIRYAGSPIPMSFSEANYKHQVVDVKIDGVNPIEIQSVEIPLKVELKRAGLPNQPLPKEQLFEFLNQLPELTPDLNLEDAPYLEVNVLLDGPDLLINQEIKDALNNKYVRLARNVAYYPSVKDVEIIDIQNIEELKEISPLELLQKYYQNKYDVIMPDELTALFNEIISDLDQKD